MIGLGCGITQCSAATTQIGSRERASGSARVTRRTNASLSAATHVRRKKASGRVMIGRLHALVAPVSLRPDAITGARRIEFAVRPIAHKNFC